MAISCPIRETISKLYAGGYNGKSKNTTIHNSVQFQCDEIAFLVAVRELEVARAKLDGNLTKAQQIVTSAGRPVLEVFNYYFSAARSPYYAIEKITIVQNLITTMERNIALLAQKKHTLGGLSLPSLLIDVKGGPWARNASKMLHRYFTKLDISSLVGPHKKLREPPEFPIVDISGTMRANCANFDDISALLEEEKTLAKKAQNLEKYYCDLANYVDEAQNICKNIINSITIAMAR
jgi:hypothetical protein